MTLRQALDTALAQNPDVVLARLERRTAAANTVAKRDPFNMKAGVGSGLAYTYGFPATINGQSPSIFQARAEMTLYDRALKYRVDQARETERGAALQSDIAEDSVAYQVYSAFLDAELAARSTSAGEQQIENLSRVIQLVQFRVDEETALSIEIRRAEVNLQRARKTVEDFRAAQTNLEVALAEMLGLPPGDQVRPALEERPRLIIEEIRGRSDPAGDRRQQRDPATGVEHHRQAARGEKLRRREAAEDQFLWPVFVAREI